MNKSVPKLGLDVTGTGRSCLNLLFLLLSQNPLSQQEVRGRNMVVFIGFQGTEKQKQTKE